LFKKRFVESEFLISGSQFAPGFRGGSEDSLKKKELTTKRIKLEEINEAWDAMVKKEIIGRWQIVFD